VPDGTCGAIAGLDREATERKDSRVNHEQGRIEGWTTLVFLGLAVAGALAAAAARLPHVQGR
jgi:hypothetical protein